MIDDLIKSARRLFSGAPQETTADGPDETQVAAAALLTEVARIDGSLDESELTVVRGALADLFELDDAAARTVEDAALAELSVANDIYRFTRRINDAFDPAMKIRLVEKIWQVIYADGARDDFEDHFIRKLVGLIHVTDQDSGAARQRAIGSGS